MPSASSGSVIEAYSPGSQICSVSITTAIVSITPNAKSVEAPHSRTTHSSEPYKNNLPNSCTQSTASNPPSPFKMAQPSLIQAMNGQKSKRAAWLEKSNGASSSITISATTANTSAARRGL